jgi:hypothetical protein
MIHELGKSTLQYHAEPSQGVKRRREVSVFNSVDCLAVDPGKFSESGLGKPSFFTQRD